MEGGGGAEKEREGWKLDFTILLTMQGHLGGVGWGGGREIRERGDRGNKRHKKGRGGGGGDKEREREGGKERVLKVWLSDESTSIPKVIVHLTYQ